MNHSCTGRQRLTLTGCKNDILSGLTVALALVPEAVAFALIAGVPPMVGLHAAFMMGLIAAIAGGRPGMISGATGATAVVMISLVALHGIQYLFAAVVLMGAMQILAGVFKLGKFIRIVPQPVMMGFVNGLAIVILIAQLQQFGVAGHPGWLSGTPFEGSVIDIAWLRGQGLYSMLLLVAATMAIVYFLPKLTRALPSSLVAIISITCIVRFFHMDTRTVGDIASLSGSFPRFHLPGVPLTWETLTVIFPYSLVMAGVGLIESLLTLRVIDEYTETSGNGNRECVGQGVANTVNGFFWRNGRVRHDRSEHD